MPEFVNPFSGVVPRKLTRSELARAVMLDIAAELEAIHLYQAHIDATDDEFAKAVLAHVRNEEEEHFAQFITLLQHLDPELAARMSEGNDEIAAVMAQVRAGASAEAAAQAGEAGEEAVEPAAAAAPRSVGSLKG
jgi:rubrerythrin